LVIPESDMSNTDISANRTLETKRDLLTLDELETVSAGNKSSGGNTGGHMYLVFNFKLVAVKTI
jgi:hypothetical protein